MKKSSRDGPQMQILPSSLDMVSIDQYYSCLDCGTAIYNLDKVMPLRTNNLSDGHLWTYRTRNQHH